MDLIQLDIAAIRQSDSQNNAYVLLLNETVGKRQLPIVIGWCEARSIAVALENEEKSERPLTHDLFKTFGKSFDITIKKIVIHKLIEGVFHSTFYCKNIISNEEVEIDARTSDAIAIAIRFSCPIFTYEDILKEAGFVLTDDFAGYKDDNSEDLEVTKNILDTLSLGELNKQMKSAIEEEDYELASKLRDEINKRK